MEEILQEHIVDENDVFIRAKSFVGSIAPVARSPQTPSPPVSVSPGKSKARGLAKVHARKFPPKVPLQRLNSRVYDTTALIKSMTTSTGADKSKEMV